MNGRAEIVNGGYRKKKSNKDNDETQGKKQAHFKVAEIEFGERLKIAHQVFEQELPDDKEKNSYQDYYRHIDRQRCGNYACLECAAVLNGLVAGIEGPHEREHPIGGKDEGEEKAEGQ